MHPRSTIVKNNILASLFVKGGGVLFAFLLVPLAISCLAPMKYGIWITLSSILSWSTFLDVGLGNGLRNKFAEAVAKEDPQLARIYVSTAYFVLGAIVLAIFVVFLVATPFLNWARILNAPTEMASELKTLSIFSAGLFLLKVYLSLIATVLLANQNSAASDSLGFLSNLISFIGVYLLTNIASGSLLLLGVFLSLVPVLVFGFASIFLYFGRYKNFAPSIRLVNMRYARQLANVGVQFFVIQIAVLIIFATGNLIVTQLFGPAEVAPYNIAYRYFSLVPFLFGIILSPFWTGFTEAYCKNDLLWIKSVVRKLILLWLLLAIGVLLMLACSDFVYKIWIGQELRIPFRMSLVMAFFVLVMTWNNIFAFFINGVGKIRLQLYGSVVVGIVVVPLAIYFAKGLALGPEGVMLATAVSLLSGSVLGPVQYWKIINNSATGIWAK